MNWNAILATFASAVFTLSCTRKAPDACDLPACSLSAAARAAKASGQRAITVRILSEGSLEGELAQLASLESFVLVRATDTGPVPAHNAETVYRWYVFDIIDAVQQRQREIECARIPRPALVLGSDRIAVPVGGGTVRVEGVDVTIETQDSSVTFEPGRRYLLVGTLCADDSLSLVRSAGSVFEVTPGGTLRSQVGPIFQFSKEIESLGTVDALREYLRAR